MTAWLDLNGVTGGYGASQVLFGITLSVDAGEVVTLMGRNGMGKTTTVRSIMGLNAITGGDIVVDGQSIRTLKPYQVAQLGIGYVPEGRHVFPNLTVTENLIATAANRFGVDAPWTLEKVLDLFPKLAMLSNQYARTLSGGEQQMLAIGRALMTNPRFMILDEATEGLAPKIRDEIWHVLEHNLKQSGQAILVIDKHPEAMARLADRHYIMDKGLLVWEGDSESLMNSSHVMEQYLGV